MSQCLGLDLTVKTAEFAAEFAELGGIWYRNQQGFAFVVQTTEGFLLINLEALSLFFNLPVC